jgi:hypothetical protein
VSGVGQRDEYPSGCTADTCSECLDSIDCEECLKKYGSDRCCGTDAACERNVK